MKGLTIKEILRRNGYVLAKVAEQLGESSQNFSALLAKDDVRTSLVERISEVTGLPVSLFYGDTNIATASGENASAVAGNNNRISAPGPDFMKELAAQRKLTEKSQEQIDRLLGVIENLSGQK